MILMVSATHLPKWRILGWLIGLAAALFSLGTIVQSKSELLAVFTLADPTGLFGARLVLFGLLANLSVILLYRSSDATLRRTGLAASVLLLCVAIASWRVLTPRNPEGCSNIAEVSGRGACLEKFALKQTDLGICRAIELRSTRLECMRKV